MNDESAKLIEKAERALRAARLLQAEGEVDAAVNRSYYAMFYAASALLSNDGRRFRKHSAVHAALGEHFAKTGAIDTKYHRWLLDAFDLRTVGDYGVDVALTAADAQTTIEHAAEFLTAARARLAGESARR